MPSVLSAARFHDEAAAYEYVEALVWPQGRHCPHCGTFEKSGAIKNKSARIGLYKCYACRKTFTVKVGTIFEASHIKMTVWLQAIHLMCSSKKWISANQLHRTLGITIKSAWFLAHRIREAMKDTNGGPLSGDGQVVEADETFHGPAEAVFINGVGWRKKRGAYAKPHKIVTLVERGGRSRSLHVADLDAAMLAKALEGADAASTLHTDNAKHYKKLGKRFARHESVNHSKKEYARGDVTTNTVEGYFSLLKRGIYGTYHHVSEKHLQRYLVEFDFRYSNRCAMGVDDTERALRAVQGVVGKRLTYRLPADGVA